MGTPSWNKCILCLKEVRAPKGPGRRRGGNGGDPAAIKLVLHYLLQIDTPEGRVNQTIVQRVLEETGRRGNRGGHGRVFCLKCQEVAASLSELHLQLEVIQMNIINLVETLRSGIRSSSKTRIARNQNARDDSKLEILPDREAEEWTSNERETDLEDGNRFVLQVLHTAINRSREPMKVPFVYLEKCLRIPSTSNYVTEINAELYRQASMRTEAPQVVKTEKGNSDDLETDLDEYFPPMESPSPPISEEELDCDGGPPKKKKKQAKSSVKPEGAKRKKTGSSSKKSESPKPKKTAKLRRGPRGKRRYFCDLCPTFSAKYFYQFEFHLQKHETGERTFKCDTCPNDLWISEKQLYDLHMEVHHPQGLGRHYDCKQKMDILLLKGHMSTCSMISTPPVKLFPCVNCSFCSPVRDKWLEHLRLHYSTARYPCDLCSEEMPSRLKLVEHLINDHQVIDKLKCPEEDCGMTFIDKHQLFVHKQIHARKFECRICSKTFSTGNSLEVHQRSHTGERPFVCSECGEAFKYQSVLTSHQVESHGAPKMQCQFCGKTFHHQRGLQNHIKAMHIGGTLSCDQCGAMFRTPGRLRRHQTTHSERNEVCEQCGTSFKSKTDLNQHMKLHSDERPFKCEFCSKAFKRPDYLRDHRRTHTGERPFVCDFCGASFTQLGPLKIHKKMHV